MIIKTRKFCPFLVTTDGETKLICVLQIFALDAHIMMCFRYHFRVKGLLFDLKQRCRKVNPFRWFDLVPLLKIRSSRISKQRCALWLNEPYSSRFSMNPSTVGNRSKNIRNAYGTNLQVKKILQMVVSCKLRL